MLRVAAIFRDWSNAWAFVIPALPEITLPARSNHA